MDTKEVCKKAEELANTFNPEGVSPFPFDAITEKEKNLNIYKLALPDNISGAISYESENDEFNIFININKPINRQHFTTAHEIGHFYLHKDEIKSEETIIDGGENLEGNATLYRLDDNVKTRTEIEANNFAACLIMPSKLVTNAWQALEDVEECAKIFNVSVSAMSIRLERLHLL